MQHSNIWLLLTRPQMPSLMIHFPTTHKVTTLCFIPCFIRTTQTFRTPNVPQIGEDAQSTHILKFFPIPINIQHIIHHFKRTSWHTRSYIATRTMSIAMRNALHFEMIVTILILRFSETVSHSTIPFFHIATFPTTTIYRATIWCTLC